MDNQRLFSKCQCPNPGFCPIFNRTMGIHPPDWKWCQKTNQEEREKYHYLLSKAPPSANQEKINLYNRLKEEGKEKYFYLYFLTHIRRNHFCKKAILEQDNINDKIINYIENQEKKEIDFSNIEILCLGHSDKQFSTIEDRPYLTKINLNEIDAGKYSGNEWAESRAFVSQKNLFKNNTDFIGFITASWNNKYESYSRIDNFHNWENARVLLNSKAKDNIVLCADIFCPCCWIDEKRGGILNEMFSINNDVLNTFLKIITIYNDFKHIQVPFSQQMIFHKNIFEKYKNFLASQDVFEKINWIVDRFEFKNRSKYEYQRKNAYFMEMLTCFWFARESYFYLPNALRREDWYTPQSIKARLE